MNKFDQSLTFANFKGSILNGKASQRKRQRALQKSFNLYEISFFGQTRLFYASSPKDYIPADISSTDPGDISK
jgi:hypothetical protein